MHLALIKVVYMLKKKAENTFGDKKSGFCFWQLGCILTWNQSLFGVYCEDSCAA